MHMKTILFDSLWNHLCVFFLFTYLICSQQYDDMKRQTNSQTERGLTEMELKNNQSSTNNGSDNVIKKFSRRPPNKRVFVLSDSSDEENELSNAQSKVPQGAKRKNTSKEGKTSEI